MIYNVFDICLDIINVYNTGQLAM